MTAQWDDDVHHALHVALTGEAQGYYADFAARPRRRSLLAKVLTRGFLHDGTLSTFRGRHWGAPVDVEPLDGRRFLGYLQTHDQVGNRVAGDRVARSLAPGLQAIGAALYLLRPTTPMIFMGEEWAASTPWQFFTDFDDEGWPTRCGGPAGRVRRARLGRRRRPRPAGPRDPRRLGARLGRGPPRRPRPDAGLVPRAHRAAPAGSRTCRTAVSTWSRSTRTPRRVAQRAPWRRCGGGQLRVSCPGAFGPGR